MWQKEYLKPFEFESEEPDQDNKPLIAEECVSEINECILEIDRNRRVMEEWERSNNSRMFMIRGQQNLIKSMRCLP